jgi:hypothetical protein
MSQFWGSHQRFFKQLITAIKIPTCIAEIQKALDNNQSIVVSVASTGEAQQDRMVQKARENESSLDDIDWSPREVLDHLITQVFPIHANEEVVDPKTGRKSWRPVKDKDGNPVIDRVALAQREALRDSLTDIALPGNPKVADFPTLEAAGAIAERIDGKKRFFIPTDAAAGMPVLEKILERWPVMRANTGEALHSLRGEPDGLTPDEQRVQNSVLDKLHAHPEVYLAEYTRRFGNILNTDDAAKLFPEYNHSLETRTQYRLAVQPAARWIRDELFRRALQTSSKRVAVFIGGGPGAGKSTLLRENPLIARESAVVLDAMLSDLAAVKQLVDLATGAGKHVTITYVHRDALQAYRAVLQRSVTEGRIPSVAYFLEARAGAARTIRALAQEYADDSKVAVEAIENIGESGGRPFRTIDTLPLEDYTQIRKRLYELLDAEYAAGRITEAVYRQARRDDGEGSRSLGGRPSNHRPESGRSQGTRQTLGTGERTPGEVARQPILTDSPRAVYKHGVVYVNPAALTVLHRAEKTRDDWEASHLSAPSTFALRGALMRMSMAKDADKTALQALAGVLADAQKDNASVIVCEVRPGESFASLKAKLRHERMHRAQHALSGSPSVRDHMDWDTFLQHPLAERSARALPTIPSWRPRSARTWPAGLSAGGVCACPTMRPSHSTESMWIC